MRQIYLIVTLGSFLTLWTTVTTAFAPQFTATTTIVTTTTATSRRYMSVIRGEDENAVPFDAGAGGVRLAETSAIKVSGEVNHKPGSANPKPSELLRYTKLQEILKDDEARLMSGIKIVCTGRGTENFADPGTGTAKEVTLSPLDAVRDATLNAMTTAQDVDRIVINFLGGDDLMIMEVMAAVEQLVLNLDVKTRTKISFHSLCHTSLPAGQTTLTVVGLMNDSNSEEQGTLRGVEASVANGEVYFRDGSYFTVVKEDIDAAVA